MRRSKTKIRPFMRFLFVFYGLLILWLLFGRPSQWVEGADYGTLIRGNINLKPLYTIRNYWHVICHGQDFSLVVHCTVNLLGNVLLFIPIGWWLPGIFPKQRNFLLFFITCLFFDLLAETVQLFTLLGSFDIDDIILNMTGFLLGFFFWKLAHRKTRKK